MYSRLKTLILQRKSHCCISQNHFANHQFYLKRTQLFSIKFLFAVFFISLWNYTSFLKPSANIQHKNNIINTESTYLIQPIVNAKRVAVALHRHLVNHKFSLRRPQLSAIKFLFAVLFLSFSLSLKLLSLLCGGKNKERCMLAHWRQQLQVRVVVHFPSRPQAICNWLLPTGFFYLCACA